MPCPYHRFQGFAFAALLLPFTHQGMSPGHIRFQPGGPDGTGFIFCLN